jgi:hypothetical protein
VSANGVSANGKATNGATGDDVASQSTARNYLAVLRDRRYVLYLVAAFFYTAVYMQYLSTLPLDVKASGLPIFWYTVAVSLNGLIVILIELPITRVSQRWPIRRTVSLAFAMVGIGMAIYGLPLGPAVIIVGTLVWTMAEIIGAPVVFAYPGMAGPPKLKAYYIGSFQFSFGLGSAVGQAAGVTLFTYLGHGVWPVVALGAVVAVIFALLSLRSVPANALSAQNAS